MSYKYPLGVHTLNSFGLLSCTLLCCKSCMALEYTVTLNYLLCGTTCTALANLFTISSYIHVANSCT